MTSRRLRERRLRRWKTWMTCPGLNIYAQKVGYAGPRMVTIARLIGHVTAFIQANPPETLPTDISLSQFLAIQEKGVSAWEFEPELEIANCFVEARTEIEFFDSECSVQSNLPIPKQNEVYYWEAKVYDKPESSLISIGVSTKPYPLFRLPGIFDCHHLPVKILLMLSRMAQVLNSLYLDWPA